MTPSRSRLQLQEPPYDHDLQRSIPRTESTTTLKPKHDELKFELLQVQNQLRQESQANEELTEHIQTLESQNYQLRQQNQECRDQLNQSLPQCETCIDYIKDVKRLEIAV